MNSCDTMALASGSLSTSTPLQSKMTKGPPLPKADDAGWSYAKTNHHGEDKHPVRVGKDGMLQPWRCAHGAGGNCGDKLARSRQTKMAGTSPAMQFKSRR